MNRLLIMFIVYFVSVYNQVVNYDRTMIYILYMNLHNIQSKMVYISLVLDDAPVTRPYICQRTPTYGDTSDK